MAPNNIARYADIADVLAALGPSRRRRHVLFSKRAAQDWRFRAYRYLALLREQGGGSCLYDDLILRLPREEPNVISIEPTAGACLPSPTPTHAGLDPDLLAAAKRLAKELGL